MSDESATKPEPKNQPPPGGPDRPRPSAVFLSVLIVGILLTSGIGLYFATQNEKEIKGQLDPNSIPKWVNQLTGPPPVYVGTEEIDPNTGNLTQTYRVTAVEMTEQILPAGFPKTTVLGYGGLAKDAITGEPLGFVSNSPGPTFEALRGQAINVEYINNITQPEFLAVDPTINWANPNGMATPQAPYAQFPGGYSQAQSQVPISTHLHGGEVQSTSDGGPDSWYTATGVKGMAYNTYIPAPSNAAWDHYPNQQPSATLWYHDHSMGLTRINVYSGMAGFYLLRDPTDAIADLLPTGKYDVPLAIQDRNFNADGSLNFPTSSLNTSDHPYWNPEFFGNTIMVNGLVWPNMNVDQGQYRFRLLDGSNARFYNLSLEVQGTGQLLPFTMIGTEGGYLQGAVNMTSTLIAPGQRDEVLVDFSGLAPGTKVIMKNDAGAPYPMGDPDNFHASTVGQIVQFTVQGHSGFQAKQLPGVLNPTLSGGLFPTLSSPTTVRYLTLKEFDDGDGNPTIITLNGQTMDAPVSETPTVGSTEEWVIINLTPDAHPIHLHLVTFQVESRTDFDAESYTKDWLAINTEALGPGPWNTTPNTFAPDHYLVNGTVTGPDPSEKAWKDTVIMYPGQVTEILVRFTEQDGNPFPFDATVGPGYVWHCHIVDHEDNEMMRPYVLKN